MRLTGTPRSPPALSQAPGTPCSSGRELRLRSPTFVAASTSMPYTQASRIALLHAPAKNCRPLRSRLKSDSSDYAICNGRDQSTHQGMAQSLGKIKPDTDPAFATVPQHKDWGSRWCQATAHLAYNSLPCHASSWVSFCGSALLTSKNNTRPVQG